MNFLKPHLQIAAFQRTQARLQGVKPTLVASKTLSDILKSANAWGFYKLVFKYRKNGNVCFLFLVENEQKIFKNQ